MPRDVIFTIMWLIQRLNKIQWYLCDLEHNVLINYELGTRASQVQCLFMVFILFMNSSSLVSVGVSKYRCGYVGEVVVVVVVVVCGGGVHISIQIFILFRFKYFLLFFRWILSHNHHFFTLLTHKLEIHGCILSIVATDALVLKHQAISIHSADLVFVVLQL